MSKHQKSGKKREHELTKAEAALCEAVEAFCEMSDFWLELSRRNGVDEEWWSTMVSGGTPTTVVDQLFDIRANPSTGLITGSVYGKNQIFCGNV